MKREGGNPGMLPYGSVDQAIETLAGALAKGPYLLGERFSAADVIVGSAVSWMLTFKMLPERPEFTNYVALLETRPARLRQKALDAEFLAKFAAA
jgi:glutathione S-transferase